MSVKTICEPLDKKKENYNNCCGLNKKRLIIISDKLANENCHAVEVIL